MKNRSKMQQKRIYLFFFWRKMTPILILSMVFQSLPIALLAQNSGQPQPEFSTLQVNGTGNEVDLFSGAFQYSIPLFDLPGAAGGGYNMALNYVSGQNPHNQPSWVGYGWSLSPGAITRQKNGVPDDFHGEEVTTWSKTPKDKTHIFALNGNLEVLGVKLGESTGLGIDASLGHQIIYNNRTGIDVLSNIGAGLALSTKLGPIGLTPRTQHDFSVDEGFTNSVGLGVNYGVVGLNSNLTAKNLDELEVSVSGGVQAFNRYSSMAGLSWDWGMSTDYPRTAPKYENTSFSISLSSEFDLAWAPAGGNVRGTYSWFETDYTAFRTFQAYGYLYNEDALTAYDEDAVMMDMDKDRDYPYSDQNEFTFIPYANPDQFNVSGAGLAGQFRLHQNGAVALLDEKTANLGNWEDQVQANIQVNLGTNFGAGGGGGASKSSNITASSAPQYGEETANEPSFFRMTSETTDINLAEDNSPTFTPFGADAEYPYYTNINATTDRIARATYIGYNTYKDLGSAALRFHKGTDNSNLLNNDHKNEDLSEFQVTNANGLIYEYGVPLHSFNEINLSLNPSNTAPNRCEHEGLIGYFNNNVAAPEYERILNKDMNTVADFSHVNGTSSKAKYAHTFLLTSVKSPNYIDRTNNGCTSDDFGGYTKFIYKDLSVQKWRSPFKGFYHHRGTEAKGERDDTYAFSYGEKEITYLKNIQTKTHTAIFKTSDRLDGYEALSNDEAAKKSSNEQVSSVLQKLDRIDIYANSQLNNGVPMANEKPLKTIHFEYDYSLMPNAPFNRAGDAGNSGILTLKKVYTTYQGIEDPTVIHPWEFEYAYKDNYVLNNGFHNKYKHITTYGQGLEENPSFDECNLDRWGAHQDEARASELLDDNYIWNQQTTPNNFDPAAWQLKVIKQPQGGETHIQYEQKDYQWVQKEKAMVILPLKGKSDENNSKFYIDLSSLGNVNKADLAEQINQQFAAKNKHLYFKLKYQIKEGGDKYEYFEGLSPIISAGTEDFEGNNELYVVLRSKTTSDEKIMETAEAYLKKHLKSLYQDTETLESELANPNNPLVYLQLLLPFVDDAFGIDDNFLTEISAKESFIRLPLPNGMAKKGDGIRVKRILAYDKQEGTLYGNQYDYTLEDGGSSGVATYEPMSGKYENPLYQLNNSLSVAKKLKNAIVMDPILDQYIAPLGEFLMPSPSVGYERVVVSNIHKGMTTNGVQISEYYSLHNQPNQYLSCTYKEPKKSNNGAWEDINNAGFDAINGAIDVGEAAIKDQLSKNVSVAINMNKNITRIQTGYAFDISNYNGKPMRQQSGGLDDDGKLISSSTTSYVYSEGAENSGNVMDIYASGETIIQASTQASLDVNLNVTFSPFFGFPIIYVYPSNIVYKDNYQSLGIRSTTKVLKKGIRVQQVLSSNKYGMATLQSTEIFNPLTGSPLVSNTTDEYNNLRYPNGQFYGGNKYYQYSTPAYQVYKAMGPKYLNERLSLVNNVDGLTYHLENTGQNKGRITMEMADLCNLGNFDKLVASDLIELIDEGGNSLGICQVTNVEGNIIDLHEHSQHAINFAAGDLKQINVIRSGYANNLNALAESITTYQKGLDLENNESNNIQELFADPNAEFANRQNFVNAINAQVAVAGQNPVEVPLGNFGLQFEQDGECVNLPDKVSVSTNPTKHGNDVVVEVVPGVLECIIPEGYQLVVDQETFGIVLRSTQIIQQGCKNEATDLAFCINLCPVINRTSTVKNVLATQVNTFKADWTVPNDNATQQYLETTYDFDGDANPFEFGQKGKWYPHKSFSYKTPLKQGKLYEDAGVYENFTRFNFQHLGSNDAKKWIQTTNEDIRSPHGQALQNNNILNIPSAQRYAYNNTLAVVKANNAELTTINFESFEYPMQNGNADFESGVTLNGWAHNKAVQHTGNASISKNIGTAAIGEIDIASDIKLTDKLAESGLTIKLWVSKQNAAKLALDVTANELVVVVNGSNIANLAPYPMYPIARVGEWVLMEGKIAQTAIEAFGQGNGVDHIQLRIKVTNQDNAARNFYIDDLIVHPTESDVSATVYDSKDFRPIASFGNTHFATLMQYNAKGELIRQQIETEQGIKTIKEIHVHIPAQP